MKATKEFKKYGAIFSLSIMLLTVIFMIIYKDYQMAFFTFLGLFIGIQVGSILSDLK